MQEEPHIDGRLGLNVPRTTWPTAPLLKAYEAAGFAWVQVHTPPIGMLTDREAARRHARALRATLDTTGLRLVVHGPDDLSAGCELHDRAFAGLLDYAAEAGAERVAYHGLNFRCAPGGEAADALARRIEQEERALRRFAPVAERIGATVCVENLAPVYPPPSGAPRVAHDALAVAALVARVGAPSVAMLLDVGHAHIACALRREELAGAVDAVLDEAALVHVHDNLGARRHDVQAPGIDPLRLDLHLPPGAGSLPWARVGAALRGHGAPLVLEIGGGHRLAPVALARRLRSVLAAAPAAAAA